MYTLPHELRAALKKPLAAVLDTEGALAAHDEARAEAFLVTVGDVVTETFLTAGRVPHVMVVDFKTQREHDLPELRAAVRATGARVVNVQNPAAAITRALWDALADALERPDPTAIEVEGEEDLAVLPVLALASDGTRVAYGQPNEGVVIVTVNPETRAFAREFLGKMQQE